MNANDISDAQRFPCGCVIGTHVATKSFVIVPCSATCEIYAYAVEQARKQDKPFAELDASGEATLSADSPFLSPLFNPLCPYCTRKVDAYMGARSGDVPHAGDLSVCVYCKRVSLFTITGLRKPTSDEAKDIENNPQFLAMRAAAQVVWGDEDG